MNNRTTTLIILIALVLGIGAGYYLFGTTNQPAQPPQQHDETANPTNEVEEKRTVSLFYYNPENDTDENGNILCSSKGLVAVERNIPVTQTPIQDTVNLLLEGRLTSQERAQGIETEFPLEGFSLTGAAVNDETLTLSFTDPQNNTSGGSCRAGILWMQIQETARQFSGIEQVQFQPETLFQP